MNGRTVVVCVTYEIDTELPKDASEDALHEEIDIALTENNAVEIDREIIQ